MSIHFSGTRSRSGGLISAIAKQLRFANLQPLTKITVCFDPFHDKVKETREFLFHLSGPKILSTNPGCLLKTNIICDRSDPIVTCDFENKEKLIIKSANLTSLELLQIFNKHVSSRVKPVEEDTSITTKQKGKKKGRK